MEEKISDNPGVIAFPPALYAGTLSGGLLLSFVFPIDFLPRSISLILGAIAFICAGSIAISAFRAMRLAQTAVNPPQDIARARLFLRLPDFHILPSVFTLRGMRDPAKRDREVVKTQFEALDRGLSYIDRYLSGDPWAVGDRASIADCALVPVINVVNLIASSFGQPDLIDKYKKLNAYWQAAKTDEINAKVIAEQLAALAKA